MLEIVKVHKAGVQFALGRRFVRVVELQGM